MCYFCHNLNKNPGTPSHRAANCLDRANSYSTIPMYKRIYENGHLIDDKNRIETGYSTQKEKRMDNRYRTENEHRTSSQNSIDSRNRVDNKYRISSTENRSRIQNSDSYSNSCVICMDEKSNMTFIPCGHVATCESCSSEVESCPICRQTIDNRQRLYFV